MSFFPRKHSIQITIAVVNYYRGSELRRVLWAMTPLPKRGFGPPPRTVRFPPLSALSFLSLFFWKKARKTTKKTRIFYPHRTSKIPGKEGKNAQKNKEFPRKGKNKEFHKNTERKDREVSVLCFSCTRIHDRADQKLSCRGPKRASGERVLWYVFLPPYGLHPPISRPNLPY